MQGSGGGRPLIALFTKNRTNPAYAAARIGAERAAERHGAQVAHYVPDKPDDIAGQIALVDRAIADRPDAVVFVPVHDTAVNASVRKLNAARIPVVSLVFGSSTAGGAYLPGMSDYVVMVKERAKVFLGGPPLVKMATGEDANDEELGGAEMHARQSGLADYMALDERDALRLGRRIVARLHWTKRGPAPAAEGKQPRYDPEELLGIPSADPKVPFPIREVIARLVDDSEFDEWKPLYGTNLVTGWARLHGWEIGILANDRGVLFSEESQKAAQFIQLANQIDTVGFRAERQYRAKTVGRGLRVSRARRLAAGARLVIDA